MKATSVVSNTYLPLKYCHVGLSDFEVEQTPGLYWSTDTKLIGSRNSFGIETEYNTTCFVVFLKKRKDSHIMILV